MHEMETNGIMPAGYHNRLVVIISMVNTKYTTLGHRRSPLPGQFPFTILRSKRPNRAKSDKATSYYELETGSMPFSRSSSQLCRVAANTGYCKPIKSECN